MTPESSVGETESVVVAPPSSLCHLPYPALRVQPPRTSDEVLSVAVQRKCPPTQIHTQAHKRCQLQTPGSAGGRGTGEPMRVNSRELGLANCRRAL